MPLERAQYNQDTRKAIPTRRAPDRGHGRERRLDAIRIAIYRRMNCSMQRRRTVAKRRGPQMGTADLVGTSKMLAAGIPQRIPEIKQIERRQRDERAAEQIVARRREAGPEADQFDKRCDISRRRRLAPECAHDDTVEGGESRCGRSDNRRSLGGKPDATRRG